MLKTLGRSVYLTQFEEQRASLSAFAAGGAPVFISLHISEEFDAAYCARVQEMCDFLSAQGWRILADVSEKTIRQFGCADLTALAKRLHLWGLRLDCGFSVEQMCALAQQLPVAVNASTTTPEVARQLAAGTVIAMHNFYPRPETGLDPEFLRESTAALQAEGLQVYGFIPGDALLRGPLYKGLPTLEAHRTAAPSAAFADLAVNYGLDGIFAGDPEVSTREQEYIRHFCTTGELCLPVALRPGYETLYDRTFTCRPDSPKTLVRYQESRLYSCFGSTVQPDNCTERRRRCVTIGREVQLLWQDTKEKVTALDVDEEFGLIVRRENGTVETVRTGEVSVRGLYGYVE